MARTNPSRPPSHTVTGRSPPHIAAMKASMLQSWLWRTVTSTTFHTSMIPADHPLVVPHSAFAWAPDHIAGAASFGCSRRYWYTVSRLSTRSSSTPPAGGPAGPACRPPRGPPPSPWPAQLSRPAGSRSPTGPNSSAPLPASFPPAHHPHQPRPHNSRCRVRLHRDGYAPGFVDGPRADRPVAHPAGHTDRTLVGRPTVPR